MSDVGIVAYGAVSGLGEGRAAIHVGVVGQEPTSAIAHDPELAQAGLGRPFAVRAAVPQGVSHRAAWLLARALDACTHALDAERPTWRTERVGLVIGTSSGGMRQAERAFACIDAGEPVTEPEAATYFGPLAEVVRQVGMVFQPAQLVLGACASSALSIGLGARWLEADACDVVLAGGFDDVTPFVAAGFEALRAITASPPPRPFGRGRDGMALGEGAGVVALARHCTKALAFVRGFGAASDATHLTAPDREGRGLAQAVGAALREADRSTLDLVVSHGTATPFNDPVDAKVIASLGAPAPVVAALKAQLGHALGAAGVLEVLHGVDAMVHQVLPGSLSAGDVDPQAWVRMLPRAQAGVVDGVLKTAAAFGGANAALVLARAPGPSRPVRRAYVTAAAHVSVELTVDELAQRLGLPAARVARADGLVRLSLAAVAALRAENLDLRGAGIVVGSALATVDTNLRFARGLPSRGGRGVEPRLFPYTSPNAAAGECSIALGLTGPSLAVGGGLHAGLEALATAALLVGAGDADRIVVVAVDAAGPAATALLGETVLPAGAVALVVCASPERAVGQVGAIRLIRGRPAPLAPAGHLALLPLVELAPGARGAGHALRLTSASPPDAFAEVEIAPLPV